MAAMVQQQLSLVAQFDDLTRSRNVLSTSSETEFLRFVRNQEVCRKRWQDSDRIAGELQDKMKVLQKDNTTLQTKLKHARGQIEHEMKKRQKAEQERDNLERQVALVRDLLMSKNQQSMMFDDRDREKLAFLSTDFQGMSHMAENSPRKNLATIDESVSLLSPSDISYDKTEEDMDFSNLRSGRRWKRPSAPPMEDDEDITPPEKRPKSERKQRSKHRRSRSAVVTTTTITVGNGRVETQAEVQTDTNHGNLVSTPLRKSLSANDILDEGTPVCDYTYTSRLQDTPPTSTPGMRHYNSAGRSLNRLHYFATKTLIMPENCIVCGKKIKFRTRCIKCSDCRATAHIECKDRVPLPCCPSTTPAHTKKTVEGFLADYVPQESPLIPAIIIHCIKDIEDRGLSEVGIYRIPGSEREVKELKEAFLKNKGTPNLANIMDVNVICGCVKDFLRGLKEPVLTYSLWENFVNASEIRDQEESVSATYQAVSQLPQANRDTLAYIILHLQRVAQSDACKMPQNNLAKVFGPTLVRYSTPDPQPIQMMAETRKQAMVMERLMSMSSDYWRAFVEGFPCAPNDTTAYTPERSILPQMSMLGPVGTDDAKDKTWYTPKFGTKTRNAAKTPSRFFASPLLK